MSLTYVQIETAITGAASSALTAKIYTAIGKFCYNILAESSATENHAQRVNFALAAMQVAPRAQRYYVQPRMAVYRICLRAAQNEGYDNATSDATIQALVDDVLAKLIDTGVL